MCPADITNGWRAAEFHGDLELTSQDIEHLFDAGLTERGQTPQIRSADTDATGAQGQCLEDIGSAAETAIDQNRNFPVNRLEHLRQAGNCCPVAPFRPPAVVAGTKPRASSDGFAAAIWSLAALCITAFSCSQ